MTSINGGILKRVAFVAIVGLAALVPAATSSAAQQHGRLRLALIPLQTAQLGPAGKSLALAYGSGPTPIDHSDIDFFGVHINSGLGHDGLLGGYALDYGDPLTGSTGVMEIRSAVEEYKTSAVARTALVYWRLGEFAYRVFSSPMVPIAETKANVVTIGQRRFANVITLAAPNLNPIVILDEQVAAGRFVLDVTVTAGSESAAKRIGPHLMLLLHHRLNLMLQGHLTGSPRPLPPKPPDGQAPGGPDLSTMSLQPSDVGQSEAAAQAYHAEPPALSDFFVEYEQAGAYYALVQHLSWWPTATAATYGEVYRGAVFASYFVDEGDTVTPVDLSALDDPATGYLVTHSGGGSAVLITLTNGQAGTFISGASQSTLQASDVQSLAQAAETRFDAGLGP
jgi:hypothetical protein